MWPGIIAQKYFSRKGNFLWTFMSTVTSEHAHLSWIIQEKIMNFPRFLQTFSWNIKEMNYMKYFIGDMCITRHIIVKQKNFLKQIILTIFEQTFICLWACSVYFGGKPFHFLWKRTTAWIVLMYLATDCTLFGAINTQYSPVLMSM